MISVPIDRIVPLTDARDNFSRLVADVETITDGLYVLTKGGKPAIALINIKYLEEIMAGGGTQTGHEATHHATTPHHVASKSHIAPKPVEDAKPEPIVHDLPKPPAVKLPDLEPPKAPPPIKPSFEVPRIAPVIASSSTSSDLKSQNNYDVKPLVNPTWIGEEPKTDTPSPSSFSSTAQNQSSVPPILRPDASIPEAIINKPSEIAKPPSVSTPPILQSEKPTLPPPIPSKPPINPWPIIPPRPSVNTPTPSSLSSSVGVNQPPSAPLPSPQPPVAPESSYPKMVAPPPPPPPSSLPRIPSSFQTVPVPVNGSKPPVTPSVNLPPPPVTTAPAPFAQSAPSTPIVTPKPADTIPFDQPPTTIPDPGEDLPVEPAVKTEVPVAPAPPTADTPPQSQASVQDLEI